MGHKEQVEAYLSRAVSVAASATFSRSMAENNQRTGQAFMNVLRIQDPVKYDKLSGSRADPFYVDSNIPAAIAHLERRG